VRVRFAETVSGVLPGMSARVSCLTSDLAPSDLTARARTVLPARALATRSGVRVVWVVEDGVVRSQPVRLGEPMGEGFELLQGPSPGARVVLDPPGVLTDGSPVKETVQ